MPFSGSESHAPRMVKCSGWFGLQVGRVHDGADADDVGAGVGEIGAAGAHELGFQLGLAPHEELLHFLGGLVFVVFAQVAVAAGDGDFLRVGRDLLLHQLVVFVLAPFQAFPGDEQGGFLLGLLAGDQRLDGRVALDDARQQRALVHVVEARAKTAGRA